MSQCPMSYSALALVSLLQTVHFIDFSLTSFIKLCSDSWNARFGQLSKNDKMDVTTAQFA